MFNQSYIRVKLINEWYSDPVIDLFSASASVGSAVPGDDTWALAHQLPALSMAKQNKHRAASDPVFARFKRLGAGPARGLSTGCR